MKSWPSLVIVIVFGAHVLLAKAVALVAPSPEVVPMAVAVSLGLLFSQVSLSAVCALRSNRPESNSPTQIVHPVGQTCARKEGRTTLNSSCQSWACQVCATGTAIGDFLLSFHSMALTSCRANFCSSQAAIRRRLASAWPPCS